MKAKIITNNGGYTTSELLICLIILIIVAAVAFSATIFFTSNAWGVDDQTAFNVVLAIDDSAVSVKSLERHVIGYSQVIVGNRNGTETTYYLNSNLLKNITAILAE